MTTTKSRTRTNPNRPAAHMGEAVVRLRDRSQGPAHGRVVAFPPSGTGPYYFRPLAGDGIEVWGIRYPGRENRSHEPFAESLRDIVDEVTPRVMEILGDSIPTMLLGHSMGVGVAIEVCRRVETVMPGRVDMLALSARMAPGPEQRRRGEALLALAADDYRLRTWVLSLGGIPDGLLGDAGFMATHLRTLRADLKLSVTHDHAALAGIGDVPLRLLCGDQDPVATLDDMAGWAAVSSGPSEEVLLRGGHQAVVEDADRVRALVPTHRRRPAT